MHCTGEPSLVCGSSSTRWYSLYDAGRRQNQIHSCRTRIGDLCAADDQPCTWDCRIPAECTPDAAIYGFNALRLWCLLFVIAVFESGSGTYESGRSSFCLSAAHDLRFALGDPTNVTLRRRIVAAHFIIHLLFPNHSLFPTSSEFKLQTLEKRHKVSATKGVSTNRLDPYAWGDIQTDSVSLVFLHKMNREQEPPSLVSATDPVSCRYLSLLARLISTTVPLR